MYAIAASRATPSGTPTPAPILAPMFFDFEGKVAATADSVADAETVER